MTVNFRFPGQYYDAESGLHYNWNRYYNPETERYISSDSIGLAGGLNTFLYAAANPVMYADPEGLCFESFCMVEGGIAARACWVNPVCRALLIESLKDIGRRIINSIPSSGPVPVAPGYCPIDWDAVNANTADEGQRQKEHDDYKELQKQKNYTDPEDPCIHHLKEAIRHQDIADRMSAFDDAKYDQVGRHATDIARYERLARKYINNVWLSMIKGIDNG